MTDFVKDLYEHHFMWFGLALVAALVLLAAIAWWIVRRPKKLNTGSFTQRWKDLQAFCAKKATWPLAVIEADKLLDDVLKKRHFKGKTMGERLVAAQHSLSSNDSVWFGHKLRNKLVNEKYKLRGKTEVKQALLGFLQALKDLGALKNDK